MQTARGRGMKKAIVALARRVVRRQVSGYSSDALRASGLFQLGEAESGRMLSHDGSTQEDRNFDGRQ
jgi:hypothetical protein